MWIKHGNKMINLDNVTGVRVVTNYQRVQELLEELEAGE